MRYQYSRWLYLPHLQQYLPAGYSSILNALTPLFTAVLSIFYLKNPLTKDKLLGLILGFIGVLILMWPKILNSSITGIMPILAMLSCIGATICYAIGSTYAKKFLGHCSSESLAAYTQILAGVCMLPLWIFNMPVDKLIHVFYTPKLIFSLLSIAIFCSGLSYILFFSLIRTAGTIKATSTTFLIPFFGILWAYIFLGEEMPNTAYISLIFIVISSILVLRPDKK